jgi:AcrR family transcriptional regulator
MGRMKRVQARRTGDDARDAILEAAERRLQQSGVAGLRLQEVAKDVGISHPAVLHHFGSREGLVKAVVERATLSLQRDLLRALGPSAGRTKGGAELLERVSETLSSGGHARLIAWLLLAGYEPFDSDAIRAGWRAIAESLHGLRLEGRTLPNKPSYEDTVFTVILSSLALFGQAVAGRATFDAAGLGRDRTVAARFRAWLATLLEEHLEHGG